TTPTGGVARLAGAIAYRGPHTALAERILTGPLASLGVRWTNDPTNASACINDRTSPKESPPCRIGATGYTLEITPAGTNLVTIHGDSREDARHALVTLAQLIHTLGRDLPGMRIEDRPLVPVRGVMLDISRDKVPTMASLRAFVDQMEMLKLNHLQLYTEHAFAYAGHEDAWRESSPMTPEEIRELDACCRERGVELAANQNCLGHLHRWLRLPRYAPLAEIPPDVKQWTFETDDGRAVTKTGPHSLCPTDPRSIELIRDLLDQLLPCFSSPLVNIGCDEAFDVGQGRSRDAVQKRGRAAVYFDWLRAVDTIVKRHGKTSMFWADIALRHPGELRQVPERSVPIVWGYEADAPFAEALGRFNAPSSARPWFAPGTSSWLSITGRTRARRANINSAARSAAATGSGVLTCDWGDRGHRQHWPIALHSIAYAAHQSWTGNDPARPFNSRDAAAILFGNDAADLGPWLDELGEADAELSTHLRNTNALFTELHRPIRELPSDERRHGSLDQWQTVRARLHALRSRLMAIAPASLDPLVRLELEHTLSLAEHASEKAIVGRACLDEPGRIPRGPALIRLAADLASITEDHRGLWSRRNRPGGLDDSAAHYEKIIEDYEHPGS
ncbi:MAG: family 20 glycosylhydrolase, partial [Phycisphaerae bacterium]|nr:family 20 glycosylhydrolase [Phycisphaerae bacterium]